MEYSPEVLRRFSLPLPTQEFAPGTTGLVSGEAEDQTLNVWLRFQIQVTDGVIQAVRFRVYGCPHTVAAASWVAGWLEARPAQALRELDVDRLGAVLEVPVEKLGKLLKIEDALAACWRELCDKDGV